MSIASGQPKTHPSAARQMEGSAPGNGGIEPFAASSSRTARGGKAVIPRDVEALQDALIRAHALERREPGGGKWPFAGDGPWHLIQRLEPGEMPNNADWSETLIETEAGKQLQVRKVDSRQPRVPLDQAEVAELAELRRWLGLVPERDRKLVWIATARLHAGEGRAPWKAIGRWLKIVHPASSKGLAGQPVSPDTLARRYRQALAVAVCRLNGWPENRARRLAA